MISIACLSKMTKKIMMLGGNIFQETAVLAAKKLGYHVIDVDYLPDNPAHKYADEYYNISTIDKEKVLEKAIELKIDGIVSYASDVSAPTAAYVAEAMGLPTNPYESVMVMTHKDQFRAFMRKQGLPMPEGSSFFAYSEAEAFARTLKLPIMVKPVDSSGSKGVTKVTDLDQLKAAWDEALSYSISHHVIIEEFIEKKGYQIDGDIFVRDGKIVFWGICDQHHDLKVSPYVPAGLSYPSIQSGKVQKRAEEIVQSILSGLHMTMGAYNVEYIIGKNDEVYILEIGPRNGGNLIPDTVCAATGVDMAMYTVRQAIGDDISDLKQVPASACCSSYILHSREEGIFQSIDFDEEVQKRIVKCFVTAEPGDQVYPFRNGKFGIGAMVLCFRNTDEMCEMIDHMDQHIHVNLEKETRK